MERHIPKPGDKRTSGEYLKQSQETKISDTEYGPPPEKKKFSINIGKSKPDGDSSALKNDKNSSLSMGLKLKPAAPVKIQLGSKPTVNKMAPLAQSKSKKVAQVFNADDDSDEEEMPPEAKMRMRNLGRDTPTAAGPNSYGKGNLGFCNRRKILEKELKKQLEEAAATD